MLICCQAGSGAKLENATPGIFLIAHREQRVEAGSAPALLWYLPAPGPCEKLCSQRGSVLLILLLPAPSRVVGGSRGVLAGCIVCAQPAQGQILMISRSRVPQFLHPSCRSQPVTRSSFPSAAEVAPSCCCCCCSRGSLSPLSSLAELLSPSNVLIFPPAGPWVQREAGRGSRSRGRMRSGCSGAAARLTRLKV